MAVMHQVKPRHAFVAAAAGARCAGRGEATECGSTRSRIRETSPSCLRSTRAGAEKLPSPDQQRSTTGQEQRNIPSPACGRGWRARSASRERADFAARAPLPPSLRSGTLSPLRGERGKEPFSASIIACGTLFIACGSLSPLRGGEGSG